MSRIHRYLFRELLGPTLLGVLGYGLILLMNLSLQAAEMAIRRDLPATLVAKYILLSLPRIAVLTLPMAVLLGVLIAVGRLSSDNEITALRSLGYDDRRLGIPAALLGLLAAGATFVLYDVVTPTANYAQHQLQAQIFLSSDLNREIQPRTFFEKIPNLLVFAQEANPTDGTLRNVLLYQKDATGAEEISVSSRARIEYQTSRGTLNFRLQDVASHGWDPAAPDVYQVSHREEETIVRPPDLFTSEMIRSLKEPPQRNIREQRVADLLRSLEEFRTMPKGPGRKRLVHETRVEIHKKFSIPATCFVFSLVGMPLALAQRRGGKAWGFVISLAVIATQYALLTAGEQMADRGRISPWIGLWAGNILFLAIGALLTLLGSRGSFDPSDLLARIRPGPRSAPPADAGPPGAGPHPTLDTGPAPGGIDGSPLPSPAPAGETARAVEAGSAGSPGWRPRLPAVDLYLLKTFLPVCGLIVLSLALLFSLFSAIDLIDDLGKGRQSPALLVPYLLNSLPQSVTIYILPVSLCAATLISFALLSRTQEVTALRSAGVGPMRVSRVFLAVALAAAAISYAATDTVLPATNQKALQIRDQIRGRSARSYRQPERRWVFGSHGELVTFSSFDRDRAEILDLGVLRFGPGSSGLVERIFARRATWESGRWALLHGWRRTFTPDGEAYEPFGRREMADIDGPDYFAQEWKAPDHMTLRELSDHVDDMERRGYDARELRVGLHRKISLPAVCVVMVLIALPLGLRLERRGPLVGLGIALAVATAFFFLMQAAGKLGEVGVLPPLLAAWAPAVVAAGAGLYLMASSRW